MQSCQGVKFLFDSLTKRLRNLVLLDFSMRLIYNDTRRSGMKRRFIVLAIIGIVVIVVLVVLLTRTKPLDIYGSGMIEVQEVDISTKLSGQIQQLRVDEGDVVKQGDTLVIIDHRELSAQKDEALASIRAAQQNLEELTLKKTNTEKNLERIKNLYETGDIAQKELEDFELQMQIVIAEEKKAQAGLHASEAQLSLIQTQIDNAYILSTLDGVVLSKNFDEGELVFTGAKIVTIGDLTSAWLKIYLAETDIGKVSLGSDARVLVDAYPEETFTGTVTWISSEAEFTPKNIQTKDERAELVFAIKITIPNPGQKLLPGMPADAFIAYNVHH
jgi:HlyD family secretion protein